MSDQMNRTLAAIAGATTFVLGAGTPAVAGLVAHSGPYDTLSAYPYAGASLDTRLGMTTGTIPV
ncbi:MAG: hypothetical protein FJZ00_09605, partial [Candidatus Sericytochromatia bacterium]|nr:hypothetical protein [Candidatus Tanganyikabacteria bacterium]